MHFWSAVRQHLTFTPQERRAIAFLSIALLVGQAVRRVQTSDTPHGPEPSYAAIDSEFSALSHAVLAAPMEPANAPGHAPLAPPLTPGSININTATLEQLVALPGIGTATAKKVIAFREEHGPFEAAEDLLAVSGIGPKRLARFRAYLRWE